MREGAQQASEVAHGQRKEMDVGKLAQQATIDAAMSVVGGRIEGAFGATLSTRFGARLASRYGPDIAEKGIQMAAAGAAGFSPRRLGRVPAAGSRALRGRVPGGAGAGGGGGWWAPSTTPPDATDRRLVEVALLRD